MLRAIGMTRRQVRRMIRHESVITALIGAMIGIVLGVVLAVLLIARVEFIDFAFPTTQIVVFVIAAVLVGIVAAIFPARRAAKLDPLKAIALHSSRAGPAGRARQLGCLGHGCGDARGDVAVEDAGDDVLVPELVGRDRGHDRVRGGDLHLLRDRRRAHVGAPRKTPGNASTLLIWFG